eukprot:TRINITY_DN8721_c0_g1_i1.p1 TRINITY_DN8721_c0_g1~~TRINITY_DN8721_c0_g1_i1.p1  ORF type:complete len:114 (+),score=30.23 TRINITY_DN8721_c0_g1_i1:316-657(+)
MNPKRRIFLCSLVLMIPEKVTSKKIDLDYDKLKAELGDSYTTGIQRVSKSPKEKYPYPVTTSQELGWDQRLVGFSKKFSHPRSQCIETKYADSYINMLHTSPYASQRKTQPKV